MRCYTIPVFRREALGPVLEDPSSDAARAAVAGELALTLWALHENPKSYAAWHHRNWVVERGAADLQQELALVHKCVVEVFLHSIALPQSYRKVVERGGRSAAGVGAGAQLSTRLAVKCLQIRQHESLSKTSAPASSAALCQRLQAGQVAT